jgi:hypothetical protein
MKAKPPLRPMTPMASTATGIAFRNGIGFRGSSPMAAKVPDGYVRMYNLNARVSAVRRRGKADGLGENYRFEILGSPPPG